MIIWATVFSSLIFGWDRPEEKYKYISKFQNNPLFRYCVAYPIMLSFGLILSKTVNEEEPNLSDDFELMQHDSEGSVNDDLASFKSHVDSIFSSIEKRLYHNEEQMKRIEAKLGNHQRD